MSYAPLFCVQEKVGKTGQLAALSNLSCPLCQQDAASQAVSECAMSRMPLGQALTPSFCMECPMTVQCPLGYTVYRIKLCGCPRTIHGHPLQNHLSHSPIQSNGTWMSHDYPWTKPTIPLSGIIRWYPGTSITTPSIPRSNGTMCVLGLSRDNTDILPLT